MAVLELSPDEIAAHDDQRDLGPAGSAALAVAALEAAGGSVVLLDWSRALHVYRDRPCCR